jgi:hypothetical protein
MTRAARGSLILGVGAWAGCERRPPMPRTLELALERMAREDKPGLVIVVPNDPSGARDLGEALVEATENRFDSIVSPSYGMVFRAEREQEFREILLSSVALCLDEGEVEAGIVGAKPNETILRIDDGARREDGLQLSETFRTSIFGIVGGGHALIHGENNVNMVARARRSLGFLRGRPPAVLSKFVEFAGPPKIEERVGAITEWARQIRRTEWDEKSRRRWLDYATAILRATGEVESAAELSDLLAAAREHAPLLIHWRVDAPSPSIQERSKALLQLAFALAAIEGDEGMLPFGICWSAEREVTRSRGGCSGACGMGSVSTGVTRKFVSFAAR